MHECSFFLRVVFFRYGTVQSKVRTLVSKLENIETLHLANPFVDKFDQTYHVKNAAESAAVSRGEVSEEIAKRTKEDMAGIDGAFEVYTTNFFIGLSIEQKPKGAHWP
jgi:poly(A) polymerase